VAITVACFFLNAVFAFAIAQTDRPPTVRPAVEQARTHLRAITASGAIVGLMLAFSAVYVPRWGHPWFALCLGAVIGLLMICYVAVPARLIGGVEPISSRRDKLMTSAVGGAIGATVSAPPYLMGRIGLLMLGSKLLFVPGLILLVVGVTLQAGATGAVRAVKMSVKLGRSGQAAQSSAPASGTSEPSP
jgi:hypothetical protein